MKSLIDTPISAPRIKTMVSCGSCGMKSAHTDFKGGIFGKGRRKILLLTEHPLVCEDDAGYMWRKSDDAISSKVLTTMLHAFSESGINIKKDCWRINAVQCCPRRNNTGKLDGAVNCCRPFIMESIQQLKPSVIIAFGTHAMASLYGGKVLSQEFSFDINSWEGCAIPDASYGCWVLPCYSAYTLSTHLSIDRDSLALKEKQTYALVKQSIVKVFDRAIDFAINKPKVVDYKALALHVSHISTLPSATLEFLRNVTSGDYISIDYETSGLKPDFPNHFIKTASIFSSRLGQVLSFLIDTREKSLKSVRKEWKRILTDPTIKKIGQNIKYEHRWTKRILGYNIKGWVWDTMLASHALQTHRKGITGLKFQALANFGVLDYTSDIKFDIPTGNIGKGANELNCIDANSETELLKYNSLDSVLTYWLYVAQVSKLKEWGTTLKYGRTPIDGVKFLVKSVLTFADMEAEGACIDLAFLKEQKDWCLAEISRLDKEFRKTELFKKWQKHFRPVNINSSKQLSHMLYSVCGLQQRKKTNKGEESTDKEALMSLGMSDLEPYFAKKLLEKAVDTYIAQIEREVCGNKLHAVFNLHVASTIRSSMNNPNLQNVPIRNPQIGKIIRGAFVPPKGAMILEADLKGAEVSVAACYHNDPYFIECISDPSKDMHRDTMAMIMDCDGSEVTKELRHIAKNRFVFAEFYGDWYRSCAETIWSDVQKHKTKDGTPVLIHLQDKGIVELDEGWEEDSFIPPTEASRAFNMFVEHLKEVEHRFWYEMFPQYTKWKDTWFKKYLQQGYVDSFTGFRFTGLLDKKQVINSPIQGDAYHLNQEGLNYINKLLRKEKARTRLFNQIHDSGMYYTYEDECKDVIALINHTMNVRLPSKYKWITVPIVVEFDLCEKGKSWFDKKPIKFKVPKKGKFQ